MKITKGKNWTKLIILAVIAIAVIAGISFVIINGEEFLDSIVPSSGVEETGSAVAVDNSGNIYIYGRFWGEVDFDPGPQVFNVRGSEDFSAFLCKLDSEGRFQWVRPISGDYASYSKIITDNTGNVYILSLFYKSLDLIPDPTFQSQNGKQGVFLCKVDTDGNYLWVQDWGMGGVTLYQPWLNLELNEDNNIVAYYTITDTETYARSYSTDGNLIEERKLNMYMESPFIFDEVGNLYLFKNNGLAKFDPEFDNIWIDAWRSSGHVWGSGICLDDEGNVYLTGSLYGSVNFDPDAGGRTYGSRGHDDAIMARFDKDGNFLWAKTWGHWGNDYGKGICIDNEGNILITGSFYGKVDFDPGRGTDLRKATRLDDIFLCKYDSDGKFLWAMTWGGHYVPD
jgi:hypothetical protein